MDAVADEVAAELDEDECTGEDLLEVLRKLEVLFLFVCKGCRVCNIGILIIVLIF